MVERGGPSSPPDCDGHGFAPCPVARLKWEPEPGSCFCRLMKRYGFRFLLLAVTVPVVIAGAGMWLWCRQGLSQARALARHELWPEVHQTVGRYLWIHPGDAEANLLCAEAYIKDESLPTDLRIDQALSRLSRIADSAPEGARARIAEARVELFLRCRPFRAEQILLYAMELDATSFETHYLMWKLLELTGRSSSAEPYFWKTYELGRPEHRLLRLREWFLTQFFPVSACTLLDRLMGCAGGSADNVDQVEARRFIEFRNAEPESPLGHAALARWFQTEGDPTSALELLDGAAATLSKEAQEHPYFLATLVDVLIDLGEFERADECFRRWSAPASGGDYWLLCGRVMQEVRGEPAEAVKAYDQAQSEWPGTVDWHTMNRKASCLTQMGDRDGAARERERAKAMEGLMDAKVLKRIQFVLGSPTQPELVQEVVDFYRKIGRPREASCWSEYVNALSARRTGNQPPGGD